MFPLKSIRPYMELKGGRNKSHLKQLTPSLSINCNYAKQIISKSNSFKTHSPWMNDSYAADKKITNWCELYNHFYPVRYNADLIVLWYDGLSREMDWPGRASGQVFIVDFCVWTQSFSSMKTHRQCVANASVSWIDNQSQWVHAFHLIKSWMTRSLIYLDRSKRLLTSSSQCQINAHY